MIDEVVIGLDPHKASNTIAVLDRHETLLTRHRFAHSDDGLVAMFDAVAGYRKRVWAVEGANGIGRNIAQRLVACGETVVDVPAKLATRVRVYSTGHGTKTDHTDAVAIARAAIHSRHLRYVQLDGPSVALKLLSDRRTELVQARTQAVCRLHRLLRELIAGGARLELSAEHAFDLLSGLEVDDPANQMRVELALEHIGDITRLDLKIDEITRRISAAVKASGTTLTRVYGIGPINAALILGEVGDVSRFANRDTFASYTGTAPIAVSSGDHNRHRLSRSGNRQLNRAIHIAAVTQIRNDTPGRDYYRRKIAEGHSRLEALRSLKRRVTDAVWRQLQVDRQHDQTQNDTWPRRPSTRQGEPSYRSPATPRTNGKPMRPRPVKV
jgi:transposase